MLSRLLWQHVSLMPKWDYFHDNSSMDNRIDPWLISVCLLWHNWLDFKSSWKCTNYCKKRLVTTCTSVYRDTKILTYHEDVPLEKVDTASVLFFAEVLCNYWVSFHHPPKQRIRELSTITVRGVEMLHSGKQILQLSSNGQIIFAALLQMHTFFSRPTHCMDSSIDTYLK